MLNFVLLGVSDTIDEDWTTVLKRTGSIYPLNRINLRNKQKEV